MRALLCKLILLPSVLKKKNGKEERGPRKKRRGRRGSRETQPRKPCGLSPLRARQSSRSFHYPSSPSFLPRPQLRRFFDPLTLAASLADQISSLEHFDPSERLGPNASKAEALNYLFSCFFFFSPSAIRARAIDLSLSTSSSHLLLDPDLSLRFISERKKWPLPHLLPPRRRYRWPRTTPRSTRTKSQSPAESSSPRPLAVRPAAPLPPSSARRSPR